MLFPGWSASGRALPFAYPPAYFLEYIYDILKRPILTVYPHIKFKTPGTP